MQPGESIRLIWMQNVLLAVWKEAETGGVCSQEYMSFLRGRAKRLWTRPGCLQTSVIRDKDILELMPDAGEEEIDAYLDEYTESLQKYKDVYLEARGEKKMREEGERSLFNRK